MNCFIFVKDLFSFVFLRNSNTEVCDSLKGETAEKIRVIDWRRASWNGVDWPSMAVHKQLQNERNEKKEKSLLDVLNHFTLQPAKRLDGGAWSDWVPGRNVLTEHALDRRHLETCTQRPSHMLFKNSSQGESFQIGQQSLSFVMACSLNESSLDFLMYLIMFELGKHAEYLNP